MTSTTQGASPITKALIGAALVVIGVVVLRLVAPSIGPSTVLQLPPFGTVVPALLADGTPVFVVHDAPGEIRVVQALAPETASSSGVGELVAWCEDGRRFVAGHHGRSFAPNGQRYVGSTPGRLPVVDPPVPRDLVTREWEVVEGEVAAGDPLRVGPRVETAGPPTELRRPQLDGATSSLGPPASCQLPLPPFLTPLPGSDTPLGGRGPVDHRALAAPLDPDGPDGWQIVSGHLLVRADGAAVWCEVEPVGAVPSCGRPGPLPVRLDVTVADTGGAWALLSGPLAVEIRAGVVVGVAAMFSTVWRGSSLRGGVTYSADLEVLDADRSIAEVRAIDAEPACVGPGRARPGSVLPPPGIQYVDADTVVDVLGVTDARALSRALAGPDGMAPVRVTVVADAATCRALRVATP